MVSKQCPKSCYSNSIIIRAFTSVMKSRKVLCIEMQIHETLCIYRFQRPFGSIWIIFFILIVWNHLFLFMATYTLNERYTFQMELFPNMNNVKYVLIFVHFSLLSFSRSVDRWYICSLPSLLHIFFDSKHFGITKKCRKLRKTMLSTYYACTYQKSALERTCSVEKKRQ